jgi:hypothetical protein
MWIRSCGHIRCMHMHTYACTYICKHLQIHKWVLTFKSMSCIIQRSIWGTGSTKQHHKCHTSHIKNHTPWSVTHMYSFTHTQCKTMGHHYNTIHMWGTKKIRLWSMSMHNIQMLKYSKEGITCMVRMCWQLLQF